MSRYRRQMKAARARQRERGTAAAAQAKSPEMVTGRRRPGHPDIDATAVRLLAFLSALRGPLHRALSCAKLQPQTVADVAAQGGECLSIVARSTDPASCCGWDVLTIATVPLCDDPTCRGDHRVTPQHMGEVAALAASAASTEPARVRVSRGWADGWAEAMREPPA